MNDPFRVVDPDGDRSRSWYDRAACRGMDTEMWFPGENETSKVRRAQAICASCVVSSDCMRHSLNTPEKWGIWAGVEQSRREKILAGLGRNRCA